jgi:Arc/MetJ family transcription regulator
MCESKEVDPFSNGGEERTMATNLAIDERLLEEALKVGKHKSKKDTVNEALKEYVMRRKRKNILSLFGKVEMDLSYDYRKERNAR